MEFDHPRAIKVYTSIEVDGAGNLKRVLTVETDLELNVLHPKHHQAAVDSLLAELQVKIDGKHFDTGHLKQVT